MIRAIVLDLDAALLDSQGGSLFTQSMKLIGSTLNGTIQPDLFVNHALAARQFAAQNSDPRVTFEEIFFKELHRRSDISAGSLVPTFQRFYENGLVQLRSLVTLHRAAAELLDWSTAAQQTVILSSDPLAGAYMSLCGTADLLKPSSSNGMKIIGKLHFSPPTPQYFTELVAHLDIDFEETLLVGRNWEDGIGAAAGIGMKTFWLTESANSLPANGASPDGQGTLHDLLHLARDEMWLTQLKPHEKNWQNCTSGLLGTLAAMDSLLRESEPELLVTQPADDVWSVRDTICHLRDHETEIDQARLRLVLDEDEPFISATSYDPMQHAHEYTEQDIREAFSAYVEQRMRTIQMIDVVPQAAWERRARHSIFGPTTFGELVKFMAEHDRIHLSQMRETLQFVSSKIR